VISRQAFLTAVVAREVVAEAARALAPRHILLMPLKGALLQQWVYPDAAQRDLVDVDVLVRPAHFEAAEAALARAGFRYLRSEPGRWQSVWKHPQVPLELDLHRRVARTRRHRLTADALFADATPDEALFGVPVMRPHPLDLYAHVLAHASTTYLSSGRLHRPEDLLAVPARFDFDAAECAAHLTRRGLARHARLVLALAHACGPDPFSAQVLAALSPDAVGHAVVGAARAARPGSLARRVAGVLLNPTAFDAALALVEAARVRRVGEPAPKR
jgi:hypothetical protein